MKEYAKCEYEDEDCGPSTSNLTLDSCWGEMNRFGNYNEICISVNNMSKDFFDFLLSLKVPGRRVGFFYKFEGVTFAEANLIRYSYKYKDILDTCIKLFRSYSIDNLYCAIVLSPYYWQTSLRNFGGKYTMFSNYFIRLEIFRLGFKLRTGAGLHNHYCIFYSSNDNAYYDNTFQIATLLRKKKYEKALKMILKIKIQNFNDFKFVNKKFKKATNG